MTVVVMLLLLLLEGYSERVLRLGLLVHVLMSMAEWDVNRFEDRITWIRVINGQVKNQVSPKQEFLLL
jgi:hypothetical protein